MWKTAPLPIGLQRIYTKSVSNLLQPNSRAPSAQGRTVATAKPDGGIYPGWDGWLDVVTGKGVRSRTSLGRSGLTSPRAIPQGSTADPSASLGWPVPGGILVQGARVRLPASARQTRHLLSASGDAFPKPLQ